MWCWSWPRSSWTAGRPGAALAGYLTFAVLQLVFHASHLAGMPAHDATGLVAALALDVAFPALLLVIVGTAKRAV